MTKEEIVALIESRIKSEYRKHKTIDWEKIAALKIYSNLYSINNELNCPYCSKKMKSVILKHYRCKDCNADFTK